MSKQLEQILDLLLNENNEQAESMFHDYMVSKARNEYQRQLDEEEDADEDDEDDEDKKKKPDVEDNVDLKLVSKKDGDKYEFEVHNDTDHDIKFSWGLDGSSHGWKVTVDSESSGTFHVDADEEGTVYLYHDGDQVASVDIE